MPANKNISQPFSFSPSQAFDGNAGAWSSFIVSVGTPPQDFKILPSTTGQQVWIPVPEGCAPNDSDCGTRRGALPFNNAPSKGFQVNHSSTWIPMGLYQLDIETQLNLSGNGEFGYDTVSLGIQSSNQLTLTHQIVAGIVTEDFYLGEFGLGPKPANFSNFSDPIPCYMKNLVDQNLIPSLSFGYTAGAQYRLDGVLASLTLGGYDASRFTPSNLSIPFASDDSRRLTVGVQSISATGTLNGVVAPLTTGIFALIDSSVPDIWLPVPACEVFEQAFGLTHDQSTDLYVVNDTVHTRLQQLGPTVTIKIGTTDYGGASVDITLPYGAFDLQANYPIYANATNYFPLRRAENSSQYTLGRTFLQEAYVIADYERSNLMVAQATFEDPLSERILPILPIGFANSTQSNEKSSKQLGAGPIAGIAIGAVALLCVLATVAIFFKRVRSRHEQQRGMTRYGVTDPMRPGVELADDKAYATISDWKLELPDNQVPRTPQELGDSSTPRQGHDIELTSPISELDAGQNTPCGLPNSANDLRPG